jgi:hypothetical protein
MILCAMRNLRLLLFILHLAWVKSSSPIQRQQVVHAYNVRRNASSSTTPLQVGNGNFAFGVDVTGLQTFKPFATMSTWGWHNFSLPTTPNQTSINGEKWVPSPSDIGCSVLIDTRLHWDGLVDSTTEFL